MQKVEKIQPYLILMGMFESKSTSSYTTYNSINPTVYDWKAYENTKTQMNSHDLMELQFDLSDATLQGSHDHIQKMPQVVSRYQVRVNSAKIEEDAYTNCT